MLGVIIGTILGDTIRSVISSNTNSILKNSLSEIVKNFENTEKRLINHDLQKAVARSFYLAQNSICIECIAKEKDCIEAIKWLDNTIKDNKSILLNIKQNNYSFFPVDNVEDIKSLLLYGKIDLNYINEINKKAKFEYCNSKFYNETVDKSFFIKLCGFFSYEIKNNQIVNNIYQSQILTDLDKKINIILTQKASEAVVLLPELKTIESEIIKGNKNYEQIIEALFCICDEIINIGKYTNEIKYTTQEIMEHLKRNDNYITGRPYYHHRKLMSNSIYSPTTKGELTRLQIQSHNSKYSDENAINIVLSNMKNKQNLNVLDIGCAYGFVGQSRFSENIYSNIIGIDKDKDCIAYANENYANEKYSYFQIDITDETFNESIENIKIKKNIKEFDIVFIALVLHHLREDFSLKLLRNIRNHLSREGVIIIRSSDDGSKLSYNDDGLLDKIISLTEKTKGVSDRFNGRKLYSYLFNSGYNDIKIKSFMRDTTNINYDQLQHLFNESFSWRLNNIIKNINNDPENQENIKNYDEMVELLNLFINKFHEKNFWYCEYDYIGIAKKLP